MRRTLACLLFLLGMVMQAVSADEQTVVASGFPATLIEPAADAPVVLFIAGSGPTDRDGNSLWGISASYLAKLAADLSRRGIGSLRYDKRGVPGSVTVESEAEVRFGTYVDDAATVLGWLQAKAGRKPILLLGHSEGGLVALELARRHPEIAGIVLIATPGRPVADTLRDQLQALPEPQKTEALTVLTRIERGETVADVPSAMFGLFRPSIQPFLRSLFLLRPARTLASLTVPALVIGGGNDMQVVRADFDALSASRGDLHTRWFERMNHVMVDTTVDRTANIATYSDPALPLSAGLVDAVASMAQEIDGSRKTP